MILIKREIKLFKIDSKGKELLFKQEGEVRQESNSIMINVKTDDLVFEVEFKKEELTLLRETQGILTEGRFHLDRKTRLFVLSEYGETMFDVETLSYELTDHQAHFYYELFASGESVGRFQFEVQF